MTPALIVFVVLAILLIIISVVIWKSTMPENDKIVSLIMILAVFSLVAIVNEVKRASAANKQIAEGSTPKLISKPEFKSLEREFFRTYTENNPEYPALPINKKDPLFLFADIVTSCFSGSSEATEAYPMFSIYLGKKKSGKSFEAKNLALKLQDELSSPSLYVSLNSEITSVEQLINLLGFEHLNLMEETVKHLNKKGKTPFIFIDNGHYLIPSNGLPAATSALNSLYHNTNVNIIIITDETRKEQIVQLGKWLKNAELRKMPKRSLDFWQSYIETQLNPIIEEETRKISASDISSCEAAVDLDWNILNQYMLNKNEGNTFTEFCNSTVRSLAKQYESYPELLSIVKSIFKFNKRDNGTYTNDWVSYGKLKADNIPDLLVNLEEVVSQGHLEADDGKVRLNGKATFNALKTETHMNLAKPGYDSVIKLDERLVLLQNELKELEEQYGFSENYAETNVTTKKKTNDKQSKTGTRVRFDPNIQTTKNGVAVEKPGASKTESEKKSSQLSKTRYNNLISLNVKESTLPKIIKKPEINQKWVEIFRKKPSRMQFYNEEIHNPRFLDEEDFSRPISFVSDFKNFGNYMSDFSLKAMKNFR